MFRASSRPSSGTTAAVAASGLPHERVSHITLFLSSLSVHHQPPTAPSRRGIRTTTVRQQQQQQI
jgi:hypothetical protein